jgi:P4 family phage/plasmid primase-like protien
MKQKAYDVLSRWGFQPEAQSMNWQYHRHYFHGQSYDGFSYPLYGLDGKEQIVGEAKVVRWKNAEAQAHPKNLWLPSKPDNCLTLYFSPQLSEAIKAANGHLYIVEGEKDTLSMMAAGFYNVLTWVDGALNIPENLVEILNQLQVIEISHLPDLDVAGRKSAIKLAQMLEPYSIGYKAFELPAEVGNKGDVNDLWRSCLFDISHFRDVLHALPLLNFASKSEETTWLNPVRPKTKSTTHPDEKELPDEFYRAIEQALGIDGYNSSGWSKPILCPFHDDQHPSASWHRDKHILKCFACTPDDRDNYLAIQVGEKLNIDWKDYTERRTSMNGDMYDDLTPPTGDAAGDEVPTNAKKPKVTDDEIGDNLIKRWDGNIASIYGQWQAYSNGYWKVVDEEVVYRWIWEAMKQLKGQKVNPHSGRKKSVEDYLKSMLFVSAESADSDKDYCNLQNGLFNLKTGELEPHRRDLYLTSQWSFGYDSEATCPKWISFLTEAFQGNHELINLMQEAVGYSLTSDTRFEVMFWLSGEAATGKSTVIRLLKRLFGSSSVELDLNTITKNTYQNIDIFGKRLITCSEVESGSRLADSFIKRLVSGEEQVFRQIYGLTKRGETSAKLWWAMNELPSNMDKSSAIYRRLNLIPFKNPIPKEKRNLRLLDELTEELAGIFNWGLVGLKRLLERGYFPDVQEVAEAVEEYRLSNDTERLFLQDGEWIVRHKDASVKASELYMAFQLWAERNGYRNISTSTKTGKEWARLGLQKIKNGSIFYLGVTLTDSAMNMVEHEKAKSGENK